MDTLKLPYVDLTDMRPSAWMDVGETQRWHLVEMLLHQYGLARCELTEPWCNTPLLAWIRLVMHVNNIELDIGSNQRISLQDVLGARLAMVEVPVGIFLWTIA